MMTDEQIEFLEKEINESSITERSLREDLLDHMCCLIEIEMNRGLEFEKAYQKAYLQTTPNGYDEIQRETVFLLNKNKIITMKRLTFITGFFFSITLTAGFYFKVMHLPGAGLLMALGLAGFLFIFFPLILINQYKYLINQVLTERLRLIFGLLSLFLIPLGTVMKFLHLPGAAVLLGVGAIIFGFGFLPFLFFRMYKRSIEQV